MKRQKKNILFFSRGKNLPQALREWTFSHFGVFEKPQGCQWCGTQILSFVAIKNIKNSARCLIGHDCYENLRRNGQAGHWFSLAEHRKRLTKALATTPVLLRWFERQANLPISVREAVRQIKHFGFPPSKMAAEKLKRYYQNFCLFRTTELLSVREIQEVQTLGNWGYPRPLPRELSLRGLKNLKSWLIQRRKDLAATFRQGDFGQALWPLREAYISCQNDVWEKGQDQPSLILHNKVKGRWIKVVLEDFYFNDFLSSFSLSAASEERKEKAEKAWREIAPSELKIWGFDPRHPLDWMISSESSKEWMTRVEDFLSLKD